MWNASTHYSQTQESFYIWVLFFPRFIKGSLLIVVSQESCDQIMLVLIAILS